MLRSSVAAVRTAARAAPRRSFVNWSAPSRLADAAELFATTTKLRDTVLTPINNRLLGPLSKSSEDSIPLPMVLLVGSHSTGKSSFVNFLVGRPVQAVGVAPMDNTFTIVAPGKDDIDADGPALVGDPELGFGGLRTFGATLVNHTSLRIRKNMALKSDLLLVDTPGLIDSPLQSMTAHTAAAAGLRQISSAGGGSTVAAEFDSNQAAAASTLSRGYSMEGVVSWLAQRADLILFFQEPLKPGTTGEALDILTTSLAGQEHKLFLVLNKADQFTSASDYARSYGALCWNLARVIPRKDLPKIYCMCTPTTDGNKGGPANLTPTQKEALADLEATRAEIVAEIERAPLRRVDNVITRLYDSARLLHMHATLLQAVRRDYGLEMVKLFGALAVGGGSLLSLAGVLFTTGAIQVAAPVAVAALAATGAGGWWVNRLLDRRASYILSGLGLDDAFRRVYFMQLAEKDAFVANLYDRVKPQLLRALKTVGIRGVPAVKRSELAELQTIVDVEVPRLRKAATKASALRSAPAASEAAAAAASASSSTGEKA